MLKKARPTTDPRLRSLLQKAVRRGYAELAEKVVRLLYKKNDASWIRSRTVVITFEECWPCSAELALTAELSTKIRAIGRVALSTKNKNAAGLGTLAHAFVEGDSSVLSESDEDQPIRIVGAAIERPADFFSWAEKRCSLDSKQLQIVTAARRYLGAATWPWDKAFILSAAYFACTSSIPDVSTSAPTLEDFPYWVALDKHTPQGKVALRHVAKEMRCSYRKLLWASFYFESAKTNALQASSWWERERRWRLKKAKSSEFEAKQLWETAAPKVCDLLRPEALSLRDQLEPTLSSCSQAGFVGI